MKATLIALILAASALLAAAQQRNLPAALTMPQLAAAQEPTGPPQLPAGQLEQTPLPQLNTRSDFKIAESVDLRQLLSLLAQANGLNLAIDPEIAGEVSKLDLYNVTLQEALEAILGPRGLVYRIEGGLLRVTRPQLETRTFTFDYTITERTLGRSLSASVNAGVGAAAGTGTTGAAGAGGGSSTSISGSETTNLMMTISERLTELASGSPGARVQVIPMLGTIIATDLPANLDRMQHLLEVTQAAANRQVIIEAQFVEVMLNKDHQTGIDWSLINNTLNLTQTLAPDGPFRIALTVGNFKLLLGALSTQGNVNILSRPQLRTLNGQAAVFRVGTQDPFFTETRQIDRTTGAVIGITETVSTINEGVVLDVTPYISNDGFITMNIHPTVSERTGERTSAQGNTVPVTHVQETDTMIRVGHGETAVIAGLISDRATQTRNSVPVLGGLPVFGGLFRSTSTEVRKSDLVILLTPRVITPATSPEFTQQRLDSQETLRQEAE